MKVFVFVLKFLYFFFYFKNALQNKSISSILKHAMKTSFSEILISADLGMGSPSCIKPYTAVTGEEQGPAQREPDGLSVTELSEVILTGTQGWQEHSRCCFDYSIKMRKQPIT